MTFLRLQELAAGQNSNNLTDAMLVYIQRQINNDLQFAARVSHLWEVLYNRVNEHRLLIAELNVFGGPLALQYTDDDVRLYLLWYYIHVDDEVGTWGVLFGRLGTVLTLVTLWLPFPKVVQYDLLSKTLHEIYNCGSNQLDDNHDDNDDDDDELLQELQAEHNVYEFISSFAIIMEYLVKVSKRRAFWSLNEDILKITILKTNTSYPSRMIRRIRAFTHQRPKRNEDQYAVSRRSQYAVLKIRFQSSRIWTYWLFTTFLETATYGMVKIDDDLHDLRSMEAEFPATVIDDAFAPQDAVLCKSRVSTPVNDDIKFRISFDESDDEDYPAISCFDDLDFFKDFENEFPTIVYNDALTSKSNLSTEPILNPQHIDEFDLKDKTSLSKYNVLYFNDLFPFNKIHLDDLKSEKDNDDNDIDIIQSLEDIKPLPPRDQRHPFLRYQGLEYTDADIADFEERMVMEHRDDADVVVFTNRAWGRLFDTRGPLSQETFELEAVYSGLRITYRGGDGVSSFARFSAGRKSGAHISGGQFVARLAEHFGLLTTEILGGLTVAMGPERQPDAAAGAPRVAQDAPVIDEGGQADPAPVQAPPPPPAATRTMP
ncbi:hypothetical protein Tco_1429804 [Tanacetum coccineum]